MRLVPGWQKPNGNHVFGVEITLAPGWKTYWRAPGGNGIPPHFDWTGSTNVQKARISWPSPQVFDSYGFRTVGYTEHVVFPVEVVPNDPKQPVSMALDLFFGVCEEVCIPANAQSQLALTAGDDATKNMINAALTAQVDTASQAGVTALKCTIRPNASGFDLAVEMRLGADLGATPYAVIETGSDTLIASPTQASASGGVVRLDTAATFYGSDAMVIDRSALRITLFGKNRSVELSGCPAS